MIDERKLETRIGEIGRSIFETASHHKTSFFSRDRWDAGVMEWSMKDPELKVQMFRFIDVLPMLNTPEDLVAHLQEYFTGPGRNFPVLGQWGIGLASGNKLVARAAAATVRRNAERMAKRFIAGTNPPEAIDEIVRMRGRKMAFTVDILGEKTVSEPESEAYQRQYLELVDALSDKAPGWTEVPEIDRAGGDPIPRVNVSVKLSAMYSQISPLSRDRSIEQILERLRPILRRARERGVFINIDMEHYEIKDLTLEICRRVLVEEEFRDWSDIGIVLQAYLRDTVDDTHSIIEWAKSRGTPITVRLVRGAYWDSETVLALQKHWPVPVFTEKHDTDVSFETCARLLMEAHPVVKTAIASHNVRSIALADALAEQVGVPMDDFEYQMLYGMGDPLKSAVTAMGRRLRIYTPYGQLIPGMAYLVRRLLENTANESFIRQGFAEDVPVDTLLRNPVETQRDAARSRTPEPRADRPAWLGDTEPFVNIEPRDFAEDGQRTRFAAAVEKVRGNLGARWQLVIDGEEVETERRITSVNPSRPDEVVGLMASATTAEAEAAVDAATRAFPAWRDTAPRRRAEILFHAAEIMTNRRDELAAWQVFEVGKNWREADADVAEAIDFVEYYGREMLRLSGWHETQSIPGETDHYGYQPRGPVAVIPPWNFPMAIATGMAAAALVTGNTVVLKPASQSTVVAAQLVRAFHDAGLPRGVLNFLPGPGAEVGEHLVRDPRIHAIAFTGSRDVGCRIFRLAAELAPGQRHLKRVIAEMGGKNAIIVDADADLDEAVSGVIASAYGYQGQKCSACSRVIVLDNLHDAFVRRVVEAARSLTQGPADDPDCLMGPVVDANARRKILDYIEVGRSEATAALDGDVSHLGDGYFVPPTIFTDVDPRARIAQEEIFGPVLSVIRAPDLDRAMEIAMDVDYCLTGGIYSRSPQVIERARREFRVGNLYINRNITGAIVERQPFGGFRMSGIGSKAGGTDYLQQFLEPRTVTENTLRRGFAPDVMQ